MSTAPRPGRDLVKKIRIGFIKKDTSLTAWCKANGVIPSNARQALMGSWDGPKGRDLRERIAKEAGIAS